MPHPRSLIPYQYFGSTVHVDALVRLAEWVLAHDIDGPGPHQAARDLLRRLPPRLASGASLLDVVDPAESPLARARKLAMELADGTLAIQGPPGSGKTYTGARMVVDLIAARRKRVGITAMSHKVIGNFLTRWPRPRDERGMVVRIGQRAGEDDVTDDAGARAARERMMTRGIDSRLASWTWWAARRGCGAERRWRHRSTCCSSTRPGRCSWPTCSQSAGAARSLVLLGDPQQLNQPLKGTHPPGAEQSALGHLLGGRDTMPADRGLFLDETWRMHPTSPPTRPSAFYERPA